MGHHAVTGKRPHLWATLITIPSLLILIGLGSWQLIRMEWKRALISQTTDRPKLPVIAVQDLNLDISELEYRRVSARGRFLHDKEIYRPAKIHQGRIGVHIITPLALVNGGTLLIDRGWVPLEKQAKESRPESLFSGQIEVTGLLRQTADPGLFTPDNEPLAGLWYWMDLRAIGMEIGVDDLRPYFLEAVAGPVEGALPIGGQTRLDFHDNHLQYAITWYSLALILLVIYVTSFRRKEA